MYISSFRVRNALSGSLVPSNAAAGITEKAVVLTAAAVPLFTGNHEKLHGSDAHKAAALYNVVMHTKPSEQNGKKFRIGDQNVVLTGDFLNQLICPLLCGGMGFCLSGLSALSLRRGFLYPLPCAVASLRIGEGAQRDFVEQGLK